MIALKSFRPANHKQVGAKIISAHDLFKIVGSLQISSKTPEPWKIVINRSGSHRPAQGPKNRQLSADFSSAGTANEITVKIYTQTLHRFSRYAKLPNAINRLIPPRSFKRGRASQEVNRGSCQEAVIAEAGISRKVLIPRPRYGGCVRANSTAEAVSQVSTITGNDAVFYG